MYLYNTIMYLDVLSNTPYRVSYTSPSPDASSGREGTGSLPHPLQPCTMAHWTHLDTAPSRPCPHLCRKHNLGYKATPDWCHWHGRTPLGCTPAYPQLHTSRFQRAPPWVRALSYRCWIYVHAHVPKTMQYKFTQVYGGRRQPIPSIIAASEHNSKS